LIGGEDNAISRSLLMRLAAFGYGRFRGGRFLLEYVTFLGHVKTVSVSGPDFCSPTHVSARRMN
jgi:hypothetical protein